MHTIVCMSAKAERLHLADRRVFVLEDAAWRVFDEALTRPAGDVAGLRALLSTPTVLDDVQTHDER
jgi:uncharacterized protein (DUF1778 family)